ncbi:alpha-ketoacid dehydrogenase subunit beta [Saccharococcus caldoxylosilyticus]|uniref:Acetoin dehydrogenase E1 component beta subunit n=1 Tax=Parageobacillus caldoxylosilyticus NBRC 107762 TaxID=1220594 RepID=A0A023DJT4_9BACL|nr:alpha-ketoacid dehydrogenase subunit beta [Parageobacillus caldoxylosilyticus]MBB3854310.1 pyruvate dehydrogenase E1 component beta subunit [Parageobacillus caldoxylosilyticus]BDG36267.1 pyruvate dehydrogenase subunit beta [Parageobacillus caldoxylosilyticus]BDG40052.1 pyruvate dehydrogenase subunit beta [Parageobacillus caldoxylosilyticus]GAJ41530.1 acetoin dehydrogenase E1 component beta subunit [Parageobacillus caldoxylosilyticus NBRC 107762]
MQKTKQRLLTGNKAIAEAIRLEMERDPNVFVMGEDVGVYGGIFGATEGLFQQFGPERVIDTPISETAFIGAAIGAAAEGMRPIVELMFVDFFGVCMDQIYNHMAKIPYMSGGRVKLPIVLMTAVGGGYSDAAQHSQTLYATFAHLPGMKVVAPSTPYDLKGMMISAIRDDNPVVFMYHKTLQGLGWMDQLDASVGHVPEEAYTVPIGKAKVVREGTDITIVGIQMTTHHVLEAAKKLEQHGIQAEVIDLRSLVPLDRETILQSIKKTHRLLVVDEDYLSYGMTAEIAAIAAEEGLYDLDAPVRRLAVPDVPIPYSRPLEQFVLPNADKIFHEAMKLVNE